MELGLELGLEPGPTTLVPKQEPRGKQEPLQELEPSQGSESRRQPV